MLPFFKYQGTGNDFILIDNRLNILSHDAINVFKHICDRRLGVGGDGLMLLENSKDAAFEMYYVNADGKPSSMCGNGGRCIVAFAKKLGIVSGSCDFQAIDGLHHAKISVENEISISMNCINLPIQEEEYYLIDTGSPHLVLFRDKVSEINVYEEGKRIRTSTAFRKKGINVNFVEKISNSEAFVRTYERGVENETLSCGTGVTAVAIILAVMEIQTGQQEKILHTRGGTLKVSFHRDERGQIENLLLKGPAQLVFEGIWPIGS